jgi:hypothetical protein
MKNTPNTKDTVIINGVEYVPKVEAKKPTGRRIGEVYRYVNEIGAVPPKRDNHNFVDNWNWDSGNYYETEEEAKRAKERQLARVRFERRVKELNDGWEPVWDMKTENWLLVYCHDEKKLHLDKWSTNQYPPREWCVKSEELAKQLRDECGDDFKIMIGAV